MTTKKVQKKIKYYKTPLEPYQIPQTSFFGVRFEGKKGVVHKSLQGHFTSKVLCQEAIDRFLAKHQVEYIDA